jgi:hypothetical protein
MPSASVRLRNKASGALSAPLAVSWTVGGGNPDFGRNLRSWILQPGGQELVLPNGTYSASSISAGTAGAAHADWLVLRAQDPLGVVVEGQPDLAGVTRVIFVGIKFNQNVTYLPGCDRLVHWHCQHRHPIAPPSNNHGVIVQGGTRLRWMGCDFFDTTKDAMQVSMSDSEDIAVEGFRVWNVQDPSGVNHDDAFQIRGGIATWRHGVFGLDPAGNPSGNGHVQVQSDWPGGPTATDVTFEDVWHQGGGSYGSTVDGKGNGVLCILRRTNVRSWGHQFGDITTGGGGTHQSTGVVTAAPPAGAVPPDVAWRAEHPYEAYPAWLAASGL